MSLILAFPAWGTDASPSPDRPRHGSKAEKPSKKKDAAPGSRIEGQVFEADGKTPVRGASVVVLPLDGGEGSASRATDSKGRFALPGLHYGWARVTVKTGEGEFLADQAVDLPPGSRVFVSFALVRTADRPATWWKARADEIPGELLADKAGLAETRRKPTGIEYWKSPAGIAILASVGAIALAAIAVGGRGYSPPAGSSPTPTTP